MQETYSGVMTHNGIPELLCYIIKECFLCVVSKELLLKVTRLKGSPANNSSYNSETSNFFSNHIFLYTNNHRDILISSQ